MPMNMTIEIAAIVTAWKRHFCLRRSKGRDAVGDGLDSRHRRSHSRSPPDRERAEYGEAAQSERYGRNGQRNGVESPRQITPGADREHRENTHNKEIGRRGEQSAGLPDAA